MRRIPAINSFIAVAAVLLSGCAVKEMLPEKKPEIKVTVNRSVIKVGENAVLTIFSDVEMTEPIEFAVFSDDKNILVPESERLIMEKGMTKAKVTVTGVSAGTTTLYTESVSSAVNVVKNKLDISVHQETTVTRGVIKPFVDDVGIVNNSYFTISFESKSGNYQVGELLIHPYNWDQNSGLKSLSVNNYGQRFVGFNDSDGLRFASVGKGEDMNSLAWIDNQNYDNVNPYESMPCISSDGMDTPLTGEVYIALMCNYSVSGDKKDEKAYRMWIRLNVEKTFGGDISDCEAVLCLDNDKSFVVGQTE